MVDCLRTPWAFHSWFLPWWKCSIRSPPPWLGGKSADHTLVWGTLLHSYKSSQACLSTRHTPRASGQEARARWLAWWLPSCGYFPHYKARICTWSNHAQSLPQTSWRLIASWRSHGCRRGRTCHSYRELSAFQCMCLSLAPCSWQVWLDS